MAKHNFKLGDEVVYQSMGLTRKATVVTFEEMNSLRGADPITHLVNYDHHVFIRYHTHIGMYHDATPVRAKNLRLVQRLRVVGNTLILEEP